MNAAEANKLTKENLLGPITEQYLIEIKKRIFDACEKGQFSITHPFSQLKTGWPDHEAQNAILNVFREEGYNVLIKPDSDPRDPRSGGSYYEINWR